MLQETFLKAVVPINTAPYFLKAPKLSALSQAKYKHFICLIGNRAVVDIWDSVKVSHNRTTNPVTLLLLFVNAQMLNISQLTELKVATVDWNGLLKVFLFRSNYFLYLNGF